MATYQDGFKVLEVIEGKHGKEYYSATCLGRVTRYYPYKETSRPPDCGPLTVFKWREVAEGWVRRTTQAFRCKYRPSADLAVWYTLSTGQISRDLLPHLPVGTALADAIIIET